MEIVKLNYQPTTPGQALVFAEAFLSTIGKSEYSPTKFVKDTIKTKDGLVTASVVPNTMIREQDLLPGIKLRSGSSQIEILKTIPLRREVVFKNKVGTLSRMPITQFIKLSRQQGYRKVWNLTAFLETLKNLLKPVLEAIPLMWILKWVVNSIRHKPIKFASNLPKEVKDLG